MLYTLICLAAVLTIMSIGDIVSTATKAFVPSVFVAAVLFLAGFWMGWLPKDVVSTAQMGGMMANISMYMLIAHMGTLMSLRELCREWKTVVVALAGLAGMCAALLYGGTQLIEREAVIAGTPPLAGGLVAAIVMSQAAAGAGLELFAVMALLIYIVQGFVGYPITALCLKSEGKRLLRLRAEGRLPKRETSDDAEGKGFHLVPKKYQTNNTHLACAAIVGLVSLVASEQLKAATSIDVHPLVICLVLGAVAAELGIVERKPLLKSGSLGWLGVVLMVFIMGMLDQATPEMLPQLVRPIAVIVIVGVAGLLVASLIVGKILGYTGAISMALSLTALYGFPPNYVLTDEAARALADGDEGTYEMLMDQMLPKMLIGGFVTVTITSVILAGIFAPMLGQ
ncbi:MAG: hypothetical protein IJR14_00200 [Synergistaceae bacterium]|nr:hypothetical protein [Synergistaceae bacterium]